MWTDPVVEGVRKRRRELMAEFGYDPKKVLDSLKREREIFGKIDLPSKSEVWCCSSTVNHILAWKLRCLVPTRGKYGKRF